MTFLEALFAWLKVKLWFATVNQYRGLRARYQLWRYVRTLSPTQQAWAKDLRRNLSNANTPSEAVKILRNEASRLNDKSLRAVEQIDRIAGQLKS